MIEGDNNHYNKTNRANANDLRHNMTEAEIFLWTQCLRNKQTKNYSFRRQRPVLDYIADFMCLELKLIIEVDGSIHRQAELALRDEIKAKALTAAGYTILRFSNDEVLYRIAEVRQRLAFWIEDYEEKHGLPPKVVRERVSTRSSTDIHPLPPPAGEQAASR